MSAVFVSSDTTQPRAAVPHGRKNALKENRMSKVIVIVGSPRKEGNSDILARKLAEGARDAGAQVEMVYAADLRIKPCTGCLRCNLVKKCTLRDDDFAAFAEKYSASDAAAFVTPIYFHWMSSHLKVLMDRFRSFTNVKILPHALIHTPQVRLPERYAFITVLGAPTEDDALPVMKFFRDFAKISKGEVAGEMVAPKLAVRKQVTMTEDELQTTFEKLGMDVDLAMPYHTIYLSYLMRAEQMGRKLASPREKSSGPDWV